MLKPRLIYFCFTIFILFSLILNLAPIFKDYLEYENLYTFLAILKLTQSLSLYNPLPIISRLKYLF